MENGRGWATDREDLWFARLQSSRSRRPGLSQADTVRGASFSVAHLTNLSHRQLKPSVCFCWLSLQCIYSRPGGPMFTRSALAAVLHHQQNPEFYDEVRVSSKNNAV